MSRADKFYANEERAYLERAFSGPRLVVATLRFAVHERNDRPGFECPCCGHREARCIETFDDSTILINTRTRERKNAWAQMTEEGRDTFNRLVGEAAPWGTKDATAWHANTTFRCSEDAVEQILDEQTETTLFSGGWRSSKTYRGSQKWGRIWWRRGGRNETLWIAAPFRLQAWKAMRKIFYGKEKDPPIFPTWNGEPMLALGCPPTERAEPQSFRMIDGTLVELHHARNPGKAEGDEVLAVFFDEAARVRTAELFDIFRSRVMQNAGQVILSTVPDDDGMWVYEKIVSECERDVDAGRESKIRKTFYLSGYDNIFIPKEHVRRLEEGETDPIVVEQKIYGRWTRKGMFAYGDCFKPDEHVRDIEEHTPEAWGFTHDVTAQWARGIWEKANPPYCGAADFNFDPQTQVFARIFGNPADRATWTLVFLSENTLQGDAEEAAFAALEHEGGRYRGAALIADSHGFHDGHMYGGQRSKSKDVAHFKKLGFLMAPPISVSGHYSDPEVPESRTVVRHALRENQILFSSKCPGIMHAMSRAPNRRKTQKDKGTFIERRIYNFEDCVRYLAWRVFSKQLLRVKGEGAKITGLTVVGSRAQ